MKDLAPAGKAFLAKGVIKNMTPEKIAKLRDLAARNFNAKEGQDSAKAKEPTIMSLDLPIPGTSWGAEASAFLTGGEFTVDGPIKG